MDTQSILTLMIQVIFMGFVSLMVVDFFGGLWAVPLPPTSWQPPVIEPPTAISFSVTNAIAPAPQFEEIPDPWSLAPQSPHVTAPNTVILPFPTLRLLPPAKATKTTRITKKSSTTTKGASTRSRKSPPKRRMKAV